MARRGTDIAAAAEILTEGGLVAIPTETVYGLAANALNDEAVVQIFHAKNRPLFDPLIVHCADAQSAAQYAAEFPATAQKLAAAFWPGPMTLLLPKSDRISDLVTAGLPRVGLRVPAHPLTHQLLHSLDFPLAAPSANPFGYVSPTTAQHVEDQLGDRVDYILDGGACEVGIESTIIGFSEDGVPEVYRLGGLSLEAIREVCGEVRTDLRRNSDPNAPGQLDRHYSPRTELVLLDNVLNLQPDESGSTAYITFGDLRIGSGQHDHSLSRAGSDTEAARNLFRLLRALDGKYERIIAFRLPETGLGPAINDRLERAAAGSAGRQSTKPE